MKLKHILYLLCALPFLWGCNEEDDIDEIFVSGTWKVVNYFTKANWEKRNGEPVYKKDTNEGVEALEAIGTFTLTFKDDGTFSGSMQNATFDGNWEASGKERTIRMSFKGNPNTSSRLNKEFVEALKNAYHYQGDSKVLLLAPEDKRSFIQLRHL